MVAPLSSTNLRLLRIDIDKSRYDQSTFQGRLYHFFNVCDPRTVLASNQQLFAAKELLQKYRAGEEPPGTTEEEIWQAKKLVDSAFHPQTGELLPFPGRMSFQVPGNMLLTGSMVTWYQNPIHVVGLQFANQTFNAFVNYTNRNTSSPINTSELLTGYLAASSAACTTALGLNFLFKRSALLSTGFFGRLVPLIAISAANGVNIPLMRKKELQLGIDIHDADGRELGKSEIAARSAISQVVLSRIAMAAPTVVIPAFVMHYVEKTSVFKRAPWISAPIIISLVGATLVWSTPLGCALWPQISSLPTSALEPKFQGLLQPDGRAVDQVYFNKGL